MSESMYDDAMADDAFRALTADEQASRHLRAIKRLRDEIRQNEDLASAEIDRIKAWLEQANFGLQKQVEYRQDQLHQIALAYDFGDRKSRTLPYGTFGFRRRPLRVDVVDEDAVREWCRKEGVLKTQVKETYSKRDLKACVETRGEVPDGCEVVPETDEFFTRITEE